MKRFAIGFALLLVGLLTHACGSPAASSGVTLAVPTESEPPATMTVTVYFGNSVLNPDMIDCAEVFPVERIVPATSARTEAALEALFAGPTEKEAEEGYVSFFSEATEDILISLRVEGDTAYLNLRDIRPIIPNASSSCGSAAFFGEVQTTVKAALPVERIIFAIEGDPAPFYEFVQLGCDETNDYCNTAPFQP